MALVKRTKNIWAKGRLRTNPYAVVSSNGWTWLILKAYQTRKNEKTNEYARYFCAVSSPATYGDWDYGDVYVKDIPMTEEFLTTLRQREREEAPE